MRTWTAMHHCSRPDDRERAAGDRRRTWVLALCLAGLTAAGGAACGADFSTPMGGTISIGRLRLSGRNSVEVERPSRRSKTDIDTPPPVGQPGQSPQKDEVPENRKEAWKLNADGYHAVEDKDWQKAVNCFQASLDKWPDDQVVKENLIQAQIALQVQKQVKAYEARQAQSAEDVSEGLSALIDALSEIKASIAYNRAGTPGAGGNAPDLGVPPVLMDASVVDLRHVTRGVVNTDVLLSPPVRRPPPVEPPPGGPPPVKAPPPPRRPFDDDRLAEIAFKAMVAHEVLGQKDVSEYEEALMTLQPVNQPDLTPLKGRRTEEQERVQVRTVLERFFAERRTGAEDAYAQGKREFDAGWEELRKQGVLAKGLNDPEYRAMTDELSRHVGAKVKIRIQVTEKRAYRHMADECTRILKGAGAK